MFQHKPRRSSPATALIAATAVTGVAAVMLGGRAMLRHRRRFDLAGKTVLITGGSRGFGLVLARQFVDAGSNVVIAARTGADLDRAGTELQSRADRNQVLTLEADVSQPDQAAELVDTVGPHLRRDRRAGEQRRHHPGLAPGRDHRGRLPAGDGHHLLGAAASDPRRAAAHEVAPQRPDREHRQHRRESGRPAPAAVLGQQVRARRPFRRGSAPSC